MHYQNHIPKNITLTIDLLSLLFNVEGKKLIGIFFYQLSLFKPCFDFELES
jgi:hypothetical protein